MSGTNSYGAIQCGVLTDAYGGTSMRSRSYALPPDPPLPCLWYPPGVACTHNGYTMPPELSNGYVATRQNSR
eukprot:717550-Rhodomonas_salina.5